MSCAISVAIATDADCILSKVSRIAFRIFSSSRINLLMSALRSSGTFSMQILFLETAAMAISFKERFGFGIGN